MTGDNSNEGSSKGSDESLERRKPAGNAGSAETDASAKADVTAKEQAAASTILSEDANKNPLEPAAPPMKGLVAMQGILDPRLDVTVSDGDKATVNSATVAGETETKPIKTPDDMYERMFDSNKNQGKTQFALGAQIWDEQPALKQAKQTLDKTETVASAEGTVIAQAPESGTIIRDMNNAHVPFETKNKVILQVSASESIYKEPVAQEAKPLAKNSIDKTVIGKAAEKDVIVAKPVERKIVEIKTNDASIHISKSTDSRDILPISCKAIDQSGKTIGYWFDNGRRLAMSISIETNVKSQPFPDTTERTKAAAKTPQIASTATDTTPSNFKNVSKKESFAPPVSEGLSIQTQNETVNVVSRDMTASRPIDNRQTPVAAVADQSTDRAIQQADAPMSATKTTHVDEARAVENITKAIARVQEQADTTHPLGAALAQKGSAVQRDVQDVISSHGIKQEKAMSSLEDSVNKYNKLLESNKVTAPMAGKLKISTADVNILKAALTERRTETTQVNDQASKLAASVIGLIALRDPAHAHLQKTVDLIEKFRDQNLIPRLFQTAMVLGLTSHQDLSSPVYTNISAATFNRVVTDVPLSRIDFTPERQTLATSQDSRAGAAPINASQTNAQALTSEGQSVRLDNAVNLVFSAIALNSGTQENYDAMVRLVEERVEAQRLYQELPDWMKEKGFRIALSPGTPPPAESTSKPLVATVVPWIRGTAPNDARIVAPTFKPLSTLGDRHTLTGPMQGIPRVLGGFDAKSLAQYQHLMKSYPFLLSTGAKLQSALYAKPDSGVEQGSTISAQAVAVASTVVAAGQSQPAANQDEEA